MILRHVVMMKFKKGLDAKKIGDELQCKLVDLAGQVASLKTIEAGLNVNETDSAYDFVVIIDFDDDDALKHYRSHPHHVAILERMKEVVEKLAVVDFYR